MKGLSKLIVLFTVLLILAIIFISFLLLFDKSGLATYRLGFSTDKAVLAETSIKFMEDLQFKDFDQAASYHAPEDRESVNIPRLIERKFLIKPELLDIVSFRVERIHMDRSNTRARVFLSVFFKVLNTNREADKDLILYYYKDNRDIWYMNLESSLR